METALMFLKADFLSQQSHLLALPPCHPCSVSQPGISFFVSVASSVSDSSDPWTAAHGFRVLHCLGCSVRVH